MFVHNGPLERIDALGEFGIWPTPPPSSSKTKCCGDKAYNPNKECCCDDEEIKSRKKVLTGIKVCCMYSQDSWRRFWPGKAAADHCQVQYKGKAWGKTRSGGWWGSKGVCGSEAVYPDAGFVIVNGDLHIIHCEEIKLSECEHDVEKVQKCLESGGGPCGNYNAGWADCRHWAESAGNCLSGNESDCN